MSGALSQVARALSEEWAAEARVRAFHVLDRGGQVAAFVAGDPDGEGPEPDPAEVAERLLAALPGVRLEVRSVPSIPCRDGRVDEAALLAAPSLDGVALLAKEREAGVGLVCRREPLEPPPVHRGRAAPSAAPAPPPEAAPEPPPPGPPAMAWGGPLADEPGAPRTLPEALERAARTERGVRFVASGRPDLRLTYADLLDRARGAGGWIRARAPAGAPVVINAAAPEDFLAGFWGAVLAGRVPVPVAPLPGAEARIEAGRALLSSPPVWRGEAEGPPADGPGAGPDPEALALILLTSGSTGVPKAVPLTHRNVLSQVRGAIAQNGFTASEVTLNWMSLDHVGALMHHVRDTFLCCEQVQARTADLLADPLRWLELVDRHRISFAWAPNFAFGLLRQRAAEIRGRGWDLSCLRTAINAGEAVRLEVIGDFLELLAPLGLRADCVVPAFGMSETASGLTHARALRKGTEDGLADLGPPIPGARLRIAGPGGEALPEGAVGRLQCQGPSVIRAYHRSPHLDRDAFTPDGWLDTGDLAFLREGRLVVTGRHKDAVTLNGATYHCHELEAVAEREGGVEPFCTAAFAVRSGASEALAIAFVPAAGAGVLEVVQAIKRRLLETLGIVPACVVPMTREEIPRTSIGKIQRAALARRLSSGELDPRLEEIDLALGNEHTLPGWFHRLAWHLHEAAGSPAAAGERVVVRAGADPIAGLEEAARALAPGSSLTFVVAAPPDDLRAAACDPLLRSISRERPLGPSWLVQTDGADEAALAAELRSAGSGHGWVRLAGGRRWVRRLERWPLGALRPFPIRRGELVVVSGGAGGIGRILTRWLADAHGARCLALGRRPAAEAALPEDGAILYRQADVADGEAVERAAAEAEAAFGVPAGAVLHLAGEPSGPVEALLRTKVGGARALAGCLRRRADRLGRRPVWVAFSSVNAAYGGHGAGPYGAACAALETFTDALRAEGWADAWSLAWTAWRGVGMSREDSMGALAEQRGLIQLSEEEALASFERALRSPPARGLIGLDETREAIAVQLEGVRPAEVRAIQVPPDRLPRRQDGGLDRAALRALARGVPVSEGARPLTETEAALAGVWAAVLRLRPRSPLASFFDLGGSSRLAAELAAKVSASLGVELPLRAVFDAPTLEAQAGLIEAARKGTATGPA